MKSLIYKFIGSDEYLVLSMDGKSYRISDDGCLFLSDVGTDWESIVKKVSEIQTLHKHFEPIVKDKLSDIIKHYVSMIEAVTEQEVKNVYMVFFDPISQIATSPTYPNVAFRMKDKMAEHGLYLQYHL